jgi:hypothetical protein
MDRKLLGGKSATLVHVHKGLPASGVVCSKQSAGGSTMTDTPMLWKDMTREEKGALLLGWHEGKVIEVFDLLYPDKWYEDDPCFYEDCAYRIKPEPKREIMEAKLCINEAGTSLPMAPTWSAGAYGEERHYFTLTFDVIDGKPDPSSIKIEQITQ